MEENQGKPVKKKKGCLTSLLIFVLGLVVVIGGSFIFFKSTLPDDVAYTEADVQSFYSKSAIKQGDYDFTLLEIMEGKTIKTGSVEIEAEFTNAEVTGAIQSKTTVGTSSNISVSQKGQLLDRINELMTLNVLAAEEVDGVKAYDGQGIFSNINIRFTGEDEMEVYANVTDRIKELYSYAPWLENYDFAVNFAIDAVVYAKLKVVYSESAGIDINVLSLKLNGVPVPRNLIEGNRSDIVRHMNNGIRNTQGFRIDTMKIREDGFMFKGSIPESIKGIGSN